MISELHLNIITSNIMIMHDFFLRDTHMHRKKFWKRCFCILHLVFASLFLLSNYSLFFTCCLLLFFCVCVCVCVLAASGCGNRCVGCRSDWVVAVWDLRVRDKRRELYLATPSIVSSTMMREEQPCDYTNYDVSGCASRLP